jgi:hypothetical protein
VDVYDFRSNDDDDRFVDGELPGSEVGGGKSSEKFENRIKLIMKIVLTFLFLMLCTFCNAQNNSAVTWTAIDSLNKEMEKAFNQNDMAKVASFYADDAEIAGENYSVKAESES